MNRRSAEMTNMVIAFVLSIVILGCWEYFIDAPRKHAEELAVRAKARAEQMQKQPEKAPSVAPVISRTDELSQSPRLRITSARLHGSIALKGLRFDDLTLARYKETLAPDSPEVVLFSPAGGADAYFAEFGWTTSDKTLAVPDAETLWKADGDALTPDHPVTFSWLSPQGNMFKIRVALDDDYLFTVTEDVSDSAGKPLALSHYAYINRAWEIKAHPSSFVHEGPLGVFDGTLKESPYKKLADEKEQDFDAQSGWFGISDKYWLSAIVPASPFTAHFSYYLNKENREHVQVDYLSGPEATATLHFFAGAKEFDVIERYMDEYHIPLFERAIDFGVFYWLAEPIFQALEYFYRLTGSFGIAILLLTVIVKMLMFPLANKSFAATNRMKDLAPKMKDIQERYKDDKMKLTQEVQALYKREKVNPAAGCLPAIIQLPVFLALYKVLYVTIEMRHAPFYGWVHDLSAPDPSNLFTLFGLIPWAPPHFLHLGIWPMLMSATMAIQQSLSPPAPDPVQARMLRMMPLILLFVFVNVAAGLVIYWTWSNLLSILQQWYIKQSHAKAKAAKK